MKDLKIPEYDAELFKKFIEKYPICTRQVIWGITGIEGYIDEDGKPHYNFEDERK